MVGANFGEGMVLVGQQLALVWSCFVFPFFFKKKVEHAKTGHVYMAIFSHSKSLE